MKCETSTTRKQAGTTTIVEAKAVETRKGVGREADTTREIETEAGDVTLTAQEIETGIVAATETESTRSSEAETEERTAARTGAGIETRETRETEIKTVSVAETGQE
jgi:hypothetical protein